MVVSLNAKLKSIICYLFRKTLADEVAFLLLSLPGKDRLEKEKSQDEKKDDELEDDENPQFPPPGHLTEALDVKICYRCYFGLDTHIFKFRK